MSLRTKLLSGLVVSAIAFVAFGWTAWNTLSTTKINGPWYERISAGKDLVADVLPPPEYIVEAYLVAHQMVFESDAARLSALGERLQILKKDFDTRHAYWAEHLPQGGTRAALLEQSYAPAIAFFDVIRLEFLPAAKLGDRRAMERILLTGLAPQYESHRAAIDKVVDLADRQLKTDEEDVRRLIESRTLWVLAFAGVFCLALAFAMFMVNRVATNVVGRLGSVVVFADGMSDGDMTRTMDVGNRDEVGRLIQALNSMGEHVRSTVSNIQEGVHVLASSSTELEAVSSQLAASVRQITDRSSGVAAASEESSAVASSMAIAMRNATSDLGSIAGATEEASATIAQISTNSERARGVAHEASLQAARVTETVQELGRAAHEIGKVTEAIADISAQTNLLALNATIEAARAGAAGKGFSVVANEIKELARQTAAATDDIKAKVAGVQSSTEAAIEDIGRIGAIVSEVTEFVNTIATMIGEQSSAMREVASHVARASRVVSDAGTGADESAHAAHQIAGDMNLVHQRIGEISASGDQVQVSSRELSSLAERLQSLVARFSV